MKILVLPGDGIGPEITRATLHVLRAVNRRFGLGLVFEERAIGFAALEKSGTTLPDGVLDQARAADGILLGPISHLDYPPRDQGGINISAAMRLKLDLFANIRPARTFEGVAHLIIVREGTEGFYPDRNMVAGAGEFMPDPDMALSVRKITARASRRIAEAAFELAARRSRRVTAIHKANAFHLTDGLFLREVRNVAARHPEVRLDEVIVDAMAALLVRDASRFDVVVATNFHGDILSNLASELAGGLGLGGSINAGERLVAAQAQHGSAPDIAGQDRANPTSLILSAAMMLEWLGVKRGAGPCREAAATIHDAIATALADPGTRTRDLGGRLGTHAFGANIAQVVDAGR